MAGRTWLMTAIEGDRQYGGNTGYLDEVTSVYRYDSHVANHRQVDEGDLVLIRNRARLLGVAVLERIARAPAIKVRQRCPVCRVSAIRFRKGRAPGWRCRKGHEFQVPENESAQVTSYAAEYGDSYITETRVISSTVLKACAKRPNDQLSIEELEPQKIELLLSGNGAALALFTRVQLSRRPALEPHRLEPLDPQVEEFGTLLTDRRTRTLRAIVSRTGQGAFRSALIRRYGARCLVSGCSVLEVVEAAHIWPFRGPEDHHPANGLLLRADLHTLFDLNLMGIHPRTLTAHFAKDVFQSDYSVLEGRVLLTGKGRPSGEALKSRWECFEQR